VLVDGRDLAPGAFANSVARTAEAAARVDARLEPGDAVTQFELSVAAGFLALAEAGVEVAAIEAGLGGRLDATNSIDSSVTALTSIGLDHTEWLGETELEIAGEKLAVLRTGTTLVVGALPDEVGQLARETAAARGCRVVEAAPESGQPMELAVRGGFQRMNFAVAVAAVEGYLDSTGVDSDRLDAAEVRRAALAVRVPGRLEQLGTDPPLFVDVAHNRQGAAALAAALPEVAGDRPVTALIALLIDKDSDGILAELAPALDSVIFTSLPPAALANAGRPGASTRSADELEAIANRLGLAARVATDASSGLARAKELAAQGDGVVLIAGSHFLLAALEEIWQ